MTLWHMRRCRNLGKRRHKARAKAEAHARHLRERFDIVKQVYPCGDHWHVGHGMNEMKRRELENA